MAIGPGLPLPTPPGLPVLDVNRTQLLVHRLGYQAQPATSKIEIERNGTKAALGRGFVLGNVGNGER